MDPAAVLDRIAYLLETALEPTYRIKAFRSAATTIRALPAGELAALHRAGRLKDLAGIGDTTGRIIADVLDGIAPAYLVTLEAKAAAEPPVPPLDPAAAALRAALKGDCHSHSDWSDGGSPIEEMALAARDLGHEYLVLTDHSPRLKVANGLTAERLRHQIEVVNEVNVRLAPFRLLTGIEVDILDDGSLDQDPDLLAELDVVVASAHSKLAMEAPAMTRRLVAAVANPLVDILGHCTGRMVKGKGRAPSTFDHEIVFLACQQFGTAVEINCRPERLDPPRTLLRSAVELGCDFAIDTDSHAPGQLEWQAYGCTRAVECGVTGDRVINTRTAEDLLEWTSTRA